MRSGRPGSFDRDPGVTYGRGVRQKGERSVDGPPMRKLLFALIALLAVQAGLTAIATTPAFADCCQKQSNGN